MAEAIKRQVALRIEGRDYLKVSHAARLIGVSRAMVYKALHRGALDTLNFDGTLMIEHGSALRYRAERRQTFCRERGGVSILEEVRAVT